jgi:hypothetical protein
MQFHIDRKDWLTLGRSDGAGKRQTEQESRAPTKIRTEHTFSKVGIWPSINKVLF